MRLIVTDPNGKLLVQEFPEIDPDASSEVSSISFSSTSTLTSEDLIRERLALMAATQISLPLPVLPQGWTGENDFKAIGQLTAATQRNLEPVGPHFLAHARRV